VDPEHHGPAQHAGHQQGLFQAQALAQHEREYHHRQPARQRAPGQDTGAGKEEPPRQREPDQGRDSDARGGACPQAQRDQRDHRRAQPGERRQTQPQQEHRYRDAAGIERAAHDKGGQPLHGYALPASL
jgi:hypothetical protein